MKKTKIVFVFLCVFLFISMAASPFCVAAKVDTEKSASLTVQYEYDGVMYEGLEVKIYKIADVLSDGSFKLAENFEKYHINLYGISSQAEWKTVTSTACAYIEADAIEPTYQLKTDANGKVAALDIVPGLYLTTSVKVATDEKTVIFDNFLTVIPDKNEDGSYNYDVIAYPKVSSYIPTQKDIEYKVIKLWKDIDSSKERPESIKAEIYCNGELKYTEILSSKNNWTYTWKAADNGDSWTVCERDVSDEYTVTVEKNGGSFVITNTLVTPPEDGVQTGDIIASWPFILCVLLVGVVTVVVIVWRRGSGK